MSTSSTDSSAKEIIELWICHGNREDVAELTAEPLHHRPTIGLMETEHVSFRLKTVDPIASPILRIQDFEIRPDSSSDNTNTTQGKEFIWPMRDLFGKQCLFRNHFGWSNITLELQTAQGPQIFHTSVEVFATKLNGERVRGILHYLETKMEDITRSCFTATSQHAGSHGSGQTLLVLLQEIERQLNRLRPLLPRFQNKKRSRLLPKSTITRMDEATQLTERSISWVLLHPDHLVMSSSPSPSSIPIGNRYYDLFEVEGETLYEDTDIYENQIIAGYLESLSGRLIEIDQHARELENSTGRAEYISIPTGFESFERLQKEYERKFCNRVRNKCRELELIRDECATFFQKHLPVNRILPESPKMTPGFLSSPHYQELFQQIVEWHRLGRLTVLGERYLYGLRTLDKLYEFYCLYRIIEALEHSGWRLDKSSSARRIQSPELVWDISPADQYIFLRQGHERIRLFYELPLHNRSSTSVDLFVNEYCLPENRNIRERRPDFIIEVVGENTSAFIILDAKYSTQDRVWKQYLPDITMKYFHGIGSGNGGPSSIYALFLIHPRAENKIRDEFHLFHQDTFDIFSIRPILPSLGIVEVSPDELADDAGIQPFPLAHLLEKTLAVVKQELRRTF